MYLIYFNELQILSCTIYLVLTEQNNEFWCALMGVGGVKGTEIWRSLQEGTGAAGETSNLLSRAIFGGRVKVYFRRNILS